MTSSTPPAIGPFLNIINTGYGDYPGVDWSNVEPHNAVGHAAGQAVDGLTVVQSLHELQRASRHMVARWGRDFDVLVTPTMSIEPPVAGTVLAEAHAHPEAPPAAALAMAAFTAALQHHRPAGREPAPVRTDAGLPIGVQFVGGPCQEVAALPARRPTGEGAPWSQRHPALSVSDGGPLTAGDVCSCRRLRGYCRPSCR